MATIKQWAMAGAAGTLLLTQAWMAHAVPVTLLDDAYSTGADVIGSVADFDINKIIFTSLTSANITAEIYLNYHGGDASLAPWDFLPGKQLSIGDLLFDVNNIYTYGVALSSHDTFTAGRLYSVSDFWTSDEKTASWGVTYRPGQLVQIQAGTDITGAGGGSVASVSAGAPKVKITATFDPNDAFWNDLTTSGMSVHFASATCANDMLNGNLAPVPEPGTLLLLGTGLVAAGGAAWRRRRFGKVRTP